MDTNANGTRTNFSSVVYRFVRTCCPFSEEPTSKVGSITHPVAFNALPDDRTLTGNGCVSKQLKPTLVETRKGLQRKQKKENDTAGTLKTKFNKTLGNMPMVVKQITEVTYMTETLVVPGKIRKLHIDDLEPCMRRIIHVKLFKQTRSDL
ncbi:Protoporphyrin uptake protein 1 [Fusarium oxysporum f. sp. albedinis]|nr:Protoporphyrin uptake protein 1 [Fusarium oxysporum f. sp. albedinis]